LLAFTAVGLVASWGEVFPPWIPGLRGRKVPVMAAVVPAALGAAVLTAGWTAVAVAVAVGRTLEGDPLPSDVPWATHDWRAVVFVVVYAPLLLWGPLLAAVTVAYWRRRRDRRRGSPADTLNP
jgi:multisubunit Na+/H+ antiporter MnhE subunit